MPYVVKQLPQIPQIPQTYIECESSAMERDRGVVVLTRRAPDLTYEDHHAYQRVESVDEAAEIARKAEPDFLHTHYLNQVAFTGEIAERL